MSKSISTKMKQRLEKARADARLRIIERAIVQFRVDAQMMSRLLDIADHKRIPLGTLVRSWLAPIVEREFQELSLKFLTLPDGRILSPQSNSMELKQVLEDKLQGKIKLTNKEQEQIAEWLSVVQSNSPETISEVRLADGRTLTSMSSYLELVAVFNDQKAGRIALPSPEYTAIVDWTIKRSEDRFRNHQSKTA